MGVHLKGKKSKPTFESANRLLASMNSFFDEHRESAKSLQNIKKNYTNGPEGTVASATIFTVQLLQKGLLIISIIPNHTTPSPQKALTLRLRDIPKISQLPSNQSNKK